jgi:diadenosine tetraphosphate (Ap4A) HIT family hydrolase
MGPPVDGRSPGTVAVHLRMALRQGWTEEELTEALFQLVVSRRHEPDFLALDPAEQQAVLALAAEVAARLRAERAPDGYNLGVNVGAAAGQTVDHAHLHVIPRYRGDVADPRGGIRWIIPGRARYWEAT